MSTVTNRHYSLLQIVVSAAIGGPIPASVFIGRNFANANRSLAAILSVATGIILTVAMIFSIVWFEIPTIVYLVVNVGLAFGAASLQHRNLGSAIELFGWPRTILLSVTYLALTILVALLPASISNLEPSVEEYITYQIEIAANDEAAQFIYESADSTNAVHVAHYLLEKAIPLYEKNLEILEEVDEISDLELNYLEMNDLQREYFELKIEKAHLVARSYLENTDQYKPQVAGLDREISIIAEQLYSLAGL